MKIVHGQNTDRAIKFPIFQGPKAIMAWSSQIAHMTFFQIGAQKSHPMGVRTPVVSMSTCALIVSVHAFVSSFHCVASSETGVTEGKRTNSSNSARKRL